MGPEWERLPAGVRAIHQVGRFRGRFDISRGRSPLAALIGAVCRFPGAGSGVATELAIVAEGDGWVWRRRFGDVEVESRQWLRDGRVHERFGPFVCAFALVPRPGGFDFEPSATSLRIGSRLVRLPAWLAPSIRAHVRGSEARADVSVEIRAPLCGLVLAYRGEVAA